MEKIIIIILLAMLPYSELRGSIPFGILAGLNPWFVLIVSIIFNILAGIIIYYAIEKIIPIFRKMNWFDKLWKKIEKKVQKKAEKAIDKYGSFAMIMLIAIPLPGTGAYTGALAAHIIGMNFRKFFKVCTMGVIIAGIIVFLITTTGKYLGALL